MSDKTGTYLVKVNHYRGGESVVASGLTKDEAIRIAAEFNEQYQTDNYYLEQFDPDKAQPWRF